MQVGILLRFFIATTLHYILYRGVIFFNSKLTYSTEILIKKFLAGFFYDLTLCLGIILIISPAFLIKKLSSPLKILLIFVFSSLALLDLVNVYLMNYFSDGLAHIGILIEYINDLDVVLKTGVGTFNPFPIFLLTLPILFFFYPKKLDYNFSKIYFYPFILISFITSNQLALSLKINKHYPLESNVIIRMVSNQSTQMNLYKMLKESRSISDKDLKLVKNQKASYIDVGFPIFKQDQRESFELELPKANIVLFIFESVGSYHTGIQEFFTETEKEIFSNQKSHTPYFDSLLPKSLVLPNFYAHGTFTSQGQVSILCSIYDPLSVMDGQGSIMRNHYGINLKCLPQYLKEAGYENSFYNGYHKEFDNKAYFFPKIGFDKLYCREEIKAKLSLQPEEYTWGLTDQTVLDFMFEDLNKKQTPFFAMFMSVNTHAPYDHLKEKTGINPHLASLQKTDHNIKEFMQKVKSSAWFENTIFVFTADNGTSLGIINLPGIDEKTYYNRIPMSIYIPSRPELAKVNNKIASQIDLAPTLMHLIGLNKTKNHFVGTSFFEDHSIPNFQYKNFNQFYSFPTLSKEEINSLKKASMYLILNNKFIHAEQ